MGVSIGWRDFLFVVVGAAIGAIFGLDWRSGVSFVAPHDPWTMVLIGALGGAAVGTGRRLMAGSPLAARVLSVAPPALTDLELELDISGRNRALLWRLFVEVATRVSVRPVQEDGLREALSSLQGLFEVARDGLAGQPPDPKAERGRLTAQGYILILLNKDLRPLLTYWRPRLAAWERIGQPEDCWPLAGRCRQELEAVRWRILAHTWALGRALGVARLEDFLLPEQEAPPHPVALERLAATSIAPDPVHT